ncbi:hypothetical protein GCM10022222_30050 [Amycolatopsis ultiminotia]|uniref:ABC-2 type transporter transmembrane domain-containing protein n=1 Tax=Amycolatopsis ultiminotia TaxID=543629 RepID=A0ABP6W538_9PSEU
MGQWLGTLGVLVALAFALTWLTVALGMVTKSVAGASNLPMPLILLPFLGSGFVPAGSMPVGLRWFAEYQPFTPVMETVRALPRSTPVGSNLVLALGWCVLISLAGYLWARRLFERKLVR